MRKISELLNKKYGELVFGLICGLSYFIICLKFIFAYTNAGGGLLALYVAPIIICGIAIIFIKLMRNWAENKQHNLMNLFVFVNFIVLLISLVFLADYIIFGLL